MADSTPVYDALLQSQSSKEITINANFDAGSPAIMFGRRQATCSGLTWGYYGGMMLVNGVLTAIANGTVTLTASLTNYLEVAYDGTVTANTTAFTAGKTPLYTIVADTSTVTSWIDNRAWIDFTSCTPRLVKAMGNANKTLTAAESRCSILEATGALTATRNMVLPLITNQWTVFANTTGGFGVQFIGASGTGVTVADGKRAIIYSNGTNIVRVTADA